MTKPTPTQYKILDLIAQGLTNKEIAGKLSRCEGAIKTHISELMYKSSSKTRTGLVFHYYFNNDISSIKVLDYERY